MPSLLERRRMRRRLMTVSQQPIYNIYYTDTLPPRELPNFTQDLAQPIPRLGHPVRAVSGPQDFVSSTENYANARAIQEMPYFPEEDQRRYKAMRAETHARKTRAPELLDRQRSLPQSLWDPGSFDRRSNRGVAATESHRSFDRNDSTSPAVTLPTQMMAANQAYSMKIHAATAPLTTENGTDEKLAMRPAYSSQVFDDDAAGLEIIEGRKYDSLLAKIKRKIIRKRSGLMVNEPIGTVSSSAREIFSPRQLMESTTNVHSSIEHSAIEPDDSIVAATSFHEALKSLEETLKIDSPIGATKLPEISDSGLPSSSMTFVCDSCKLKDRRDPDGHTRLTRRREYGGSCCGHQPGVREKSCQLWRTIHPSETLENSQTQVNRTLKRESSRDHSPPERDRPTQSLKSPANSHGRIDCDHRPAGCCHPPDGGNLACCGLVMYGQEDPIFKYDCE